MRMPVQHPASYKDPSGFVFFADGKYYRQVNNAYAKHYDHLISSGLYEILTNNNFLLKHTEIETDLNGNENLYKILLPEQLTTISYPYEWCFDQLKDAALLTLDIVKISAEKGMILKDATPFNIQYRNGKPVFIDTLSFEQYDETQPWIAYRQFCETFLFPLLISHYQKTGVDPWLYGYPDGIPVHVAAKFLPFKSHFNLSVWMHVFLQNRISGKSKLSGNSSSFTKNKLLLLINNLKSLINKLNNDRKTTWNDYYTSAIISGDYLSSKEEIVKALLNEATGDKLLDIGANNGQFSFLAAANKFDVIAVDNDEGCIKMLYRKVKENGYGNLLPLCVNITNPTPPSGFAGKERSSFRERVQPDVVLALALVHHLALTNNIPLPMLAAYFAELSPQLIIEFVPKDDEKAKLLLKNKKDIFPDYTMTDFEKYFNVKFSIEKKEHLAGTNRFIYFMKRI